LQKYYMKNNEEEYKKLSIKEINMKIKELNKWK
jgi:tryptophanase